MPAMVTCRGQKGLEKEWNVASDDFVVPAFISIVFNLFSITLITAVLYPLYLAVNCHTPPPLLYGSLFALLFIDVVSIIDETMILSISARGSVLRNAKVRKRITAFVYIRMFLECGKMVTLAVCTYTVTSSDIKDEVKECSVYETTLKIALAAVVFLWMRTVLLVIRGCLYVDPLGLFTPGLLQHLSCLDRLDDKEDKEDLRDKEKHGYDEEDIMSRDDIDSPKFALREPVGMQRRKKSAAGQEKPFYQRQRSVFARSTSIAAPGRLDRQITRLHRAHIGRRRLRRRLSAICCCLGVRGHRSRGTALQDVASAVHTLFDFGGEFGEGDIVILGENDQPVSLVLSDVLAGLSLLNEAQHAFKREMTGTPLSKKFREETRKQMMRSQVPPRYTYRPPKNVDFSDPAERLLLEELIGYMPYALGMYGWQFHVFMNPCCGICELGSVTCCVCGYRCCEVHAKLRVTGDGQCMCRLGALRLQAGIDSTKRVLFATYTTGINRVPYSVCVDTQKKAIIVAVRGTLSLKDALTDVSFRLRSIHLRDCHQAYVHGGMLKAALKIRRTLRRHKLLEQALDEYRGYQLVITGHSLGAGVASILAMFLRPVFPRLICYIYSPPGSTCSLPAAVYTQDFITSVVLANDIVPRISFRSLIHLKYQVIQFLLKTTRPKYKILLQPRLCPCFASEENLISVERIERTTVRESTHDSHPGTYLFRLESMESTTAQDRARESSSLESVPSIESDMVKKSILNAALYHCHPEESEQFTPAFAPGRILHITVEREAEACCLGCCNPSELTIQGVSNEELCVIEVDKGIVSDHLPNEVFEALKLCQEQLVDRQNYSQEEVRQLRGKILREKQREMRAISESHCLGEWKFPRVSSTPLPSNHSLEFSSSVVSDGDDETDSGSLEDTADIWDIAENNPYYISVENDIWEEGELDSDPDDCGCAPSNASQEVPASPGTETQPEPPRRYYQSAQKFEVMAEINEEPDSGTGYQELDPEKALWVGHLQRGSGATPTPDQPTPTPDHTALELDSMERAQSDPQGEGFAGVELEERDVRIELEVPPVARGPSPDQGRLKGHGLRVKIAVPASPSSSTPSLPS